MKIKQALIVPAIMVMMAPATTLAVNSVGGNSSSNGNGGTSVATSVASDQATQSANSATGAARYCEKVQTRLQTKTQSYNQAGDKHMSTYNNMVGRLEKFIANIKAKNYDVTELESDIKTLKAKIAEFQGQMEAAEQQTRQSSLNACSKTDEAVRTSLSLSRNRIRNSYQKAAEIRSFYHNVIRPDLLEIKAQNPGAVSNSTNINVDQAETTAVE